MSTYKMLCVVGLLATTFLMLANLPAPAQFDDWGCISPTPHQSRPIYMINPGPVGDCTDCDQDNDGGLVEFLAFLDAQTVHPPVQGIVGDAFGFCSEGVPHGDIVSRYFTGFGPNPAEIHMDDSMAALVHDMLDAMTGMAAVGNLSVSEGFEANPERVAAFIEAYESGLLLVGVGPSFGTAREQRDIGDKVLMIFKADQSAPVPGDPPNITENLAGMSFSAMWKNDSGHLIVTDPHQALGQGEYQPAYDFQVGGYTDSGSFITPLASGTMTHIMAVAAARGLTGAALTAQTIDYIVSACDRPDDTFAVHDDAVLTSYAPWSFQWKYGFYNAWKALLYAYGFGVIECQDNLLYGIDNPVVAFSDDYELRGDLLVPAEQFLDVTALATVAVVTATPEGPNYGTDPNLQEIRVAGELTISGEVEASLVIDDGGSVVVAEGGVLTIAAGQKLTIAAGGSLQVDGAIVIDGEVVINGGLILLNSDLVVSSTGKFMALAGSVIAAGDVDLGGSGANPEEVELNCQGFLALAGQDGDPVILRSVTPGVGDWDGVDLTSVHAWTSVVSHAEISDAAVGLDLTGSVGVYLQNSVFTGDTIGLRMTGRPNDTLLACTFTATGTGLVLVDSSPSIDQCMFDGNIAGLHCSGTSSPRVRNSTLASNTCSLQIVGGNTHPDLGTLAEPGNNQFLSPGRNYKHLAAFGATQDIQAIANWWGTTNDALIESLLFVDPPIYTVQYLPKLMAPPVSARPVVDHGPEVVDAVAAPEAKLSFVPATGPRTVGEGVSLAFRLAEPGQVTLAIHDVRGRRVQRLVDEFVSAGDHRVVWNGRDGAGHRAASGIYFARLESGREVATRKITLTR